MLALAFLQAHWRKFAVVAALLAVFGGGLWLGSRQAPVEITETTTDTSTTSEAVHEARTEAATRRTTRARRTVRVEYGPDGGIAATETTEAGAVTDATSAAQTATDATRAAASTRTAERSQRPAQATTRASLLIGVDASTLSLTAPPDWRVGLQVQRDFTVPFVGLPGVGGLQVTVTPDLSSLRPEVMGSIGVRF